MPPERTWEGICERCGERIRLTEPLSWLYNLASGTTKPYHPDCARAVEVEQLVHRLEATIARLRQLDVIVSYTMARQ
jgi:hypothetical protein